MDESEADVDLDEAVFMFSACAAFQCSFDQQTPVTGSSSKRGCLLNQAPRQRGYGYSDHAPAALAVFSFRESVVSTVQTEPETNRR